MCAAFEAPLHGSTTRLYILQPPASFFISYPNKSLTVVAPQKKQKGGRTRKRHRATGLSTGGAPRPSLYSLAEDQQPELRAAKTVDRARVGSGSNPCRAPPATATPSGHRPCSPDPFPCWASPPPAPPPGPGAPPPDPRLHHEQPARRFRSAARLPYVPGPNHPRYITPIRPRAMAQLPPPLPLRSK